MSLLGQVDCNRRLSGGDVKRPGYRVTADPGAGSNRRGPLRLLIGGLGIALIGACMSLLAWTGAVSQMRGGASPSPILDLIQLTGLLSIPLGVVLVGISVLWWLFRIGRAVPK
jgi:hypothetical protein